MKLNIEQLNEILTLAEKYDYKPDEWHRKNLANSCGSDEILSMARELIAIRELKGEQVPVAEIRFAPSMGKHPYMSWFGKQDRDFPVGTQFFTAPQKPGVSDSMALAFHQALNDGGIGHSDLEEIKVGLRAALGVYDDAVVKGGE